MCERERRIPYTRSEFLSQSSTFTLCDGVILATCVLRTPSSAKFWLGTLRFNMSNKKLFRGRWLSSGLHPGTSDVSGSDIKDLKRDVRDISDHKYRVNVLQSGVFPPFECAIVLFYHANSLHHCQIVPVALWRLSSGKSRRTSL